MTKKKKKKPEFLKPVPTPPPAKPLTPVHTKQFEKDLQLMLRRGKDGAKIRDVMDQLINRKPLEIRHRDHKLTGNWVGRRDCHVEPDWVLIYKLDLEAESITFERTETHSDLFE